ncbi:FecR family protein [Arcticibacter svalbardensis]|nr:FecR domain-containing protein [Arcticibacter svalbardensis]
MEKELQAIKKAKRILALIQKEKLSPIEQGELNEWIHHDPKNGQLFTEISNRKSQKPHADLNEKNIDDAFNRFKIHFHEKRKKTIPIFKYAAILLCFFSIGFIGYNLTKKETSPIVTNQNKAVNPGSSKAILTLSNGEVVNLDQLKDGRLKKENGMIITKTAGKVSYEFAPSIENSSKIRYNIISTPNGGEFQISLTDGTKVWLNAGSSLRFPTAFEGNIREVELKGEGYFEVAKNTKKPFHVIVKDPVSKKNLNIEVLGTHFNVMAYDDEKRIQTTLLEGKVKLSFNGGESVLKPGEQAILSKINQVLSIQKVDTEICVAWKNGYFIFENEDLASILRKVSRWYNVDIEYKKNLKDLTFTGSISKFEDVRQILQLMELTEVINFKIEGRRIIVGT